MPPTSSWAFGAEGDSHAVSLSGLVQHSPTGRTWRRVRTGRCAEHQRQSKHHEREEITHLILLGMHGEIGNRAATAIMKFSVNPVAVRR